MLFAYKTKECNTDGFTQVEVPAATWAIFKSEKHTQAQTSDVVQSLIKRVYTEWLPTAAYKKVDGYELELYFCSGLDNYYEETWIKVEPK
jgi:AraC family transcriptional regulator